CSHSVRLISVTSSATSETGQIMNYYPGQFTCSLHLPTDTLGVSLPMWDYSISMTRSGASRLERCAWPIATILNQNTKELS
ncbi:MAG: hypothetical protein ACREWE_07975, partial [Gammaproteobacteria bacterium]